MLFGGLPLPSRARCKTRISGLFICVIAVQFKYSEPSFLQPASERAAAWHNYRKPHLQAKHDSRKPNDPGRQARACVDAGEEFSLLSRRF